MTKRIKYCRYCKRYTLENQCPICGRPTIINSPTRYTTNPVIIKYRRELKEKKLQEKGLL
jgi:rRNA maturation protein Nop10